MLAALTAVMMAGCTADDLEKSVEPADADGWQPVTLWADVDNSVAGETERMNGRLVVTRSTTEGTWTGDEQIALKVDGTVKPYRVDASGRLVPESESNQFWWLASDDVKYDVTGWHTGTMKTGATLGARAAIPNTWSVTADQTEGTGKFDFLYVPEQNIAYGNTSTVHFYHQLSRVTVRLQIKGFNGDITGVELGNTYYQGRFTMPEWPNKYGTWGTLRNRANIKMQEVVPNEQYTALAIPQTVQPANARPLLTVKTTVDGSEKTWKYVAGVTLEAGKEYTYTLQLVPKQPEVGDIYYSDGTWSPLLVEGKTPVGVVCYTAQGDDDPICEGRMGLVMALDDALADIPVWGGWGIDLDEQDGFPNVGSMADATADAGGLQKTTFLNERSGYTAATAARSYAVALPDNATTGWFLPSAGQWIAVLKTAGGLQESSIAYGGDLFDTELTAVTAINNMLSVVGDGNYTGLMTAASKYTSCYYWTSSESSSLEAVGLYMYRSRRSGAGMQLEAYDKDNRTSFRIRPMLAF